MVSELLCTTDKNANDLACGRLGMGRKAKATSGCPIIVVCFRPRHLGGRPLFGFNVCNSEVIDDGKALECDDC